MTKKTETPATEVTETRAPLMADVVKIVVTGKMTDCYVITEPMGTSKKGPLERWFEKARLVSYKQTGAREITMEITREYLHKRGIDNATLELIKAAPAPDAPAEEAAAA